METKLYLGAISRSYDARDIKLGAIQAPILIPEKFTPDLNQYPKYFQNSQPACGAHAGTMLKTIQEMNELNKFQNFSPRYLWTKIKQIDSYPIELGTDMRFILKVLQKDGICDLSLAGNSVELSLQDYANLIITAQMTDNAQPRIIQSYAFLPYKFNIDDLKQAIYQNKAVLLLIRCDNGFFGTNNPTFTEEKYGHFVVAAGYDENGIFVIDSTEDNFSLSVKYINKKYFNFIKEAGTAVDCNTETISKLVDQKRMLQEVVSLYQKLIELIWTKKK